jgi:hypothetical protein
MRLLLRLAWFSLALAACGGSVAGTAGSSHDAGAADASPPIDASHTFDASPSAPDGGDDDGALILPVCTSVPTGPTGTVSAQEDGGFPLVGGGAWIGGGSNLGPDGGQVPSTNYYIVLSDQTNTCVFGGPNSPSGVGKAGAQFLVLEINVAGSAPPGVGTYPVTSGGGLGEVMTLVGSVSQDCTTTSFSSQGNPQGSVTLTEVAADHVAGSFAVDVGTSFSGTFDVPMCPAADVQQPCCAP